MQFEKGKAILRLEQFQPLLKFIRQRPLLVLVWPAAALLIGALWWWYMLHGLAEQGHRADLAARRQVAAYAEHYAMRSERAIAEVDRMLRLLRRDWRLSEGRTRLEGTQESGIFTAEFVAGAIIADRNGTVLTSSLPINAPAAASVADRPYFAAHVRNRQDRLYIDTLARGHLSGLEVLVFSRPIDRSGGPFTGLVAVSVVPSYFTRNYNEEILGRHGFLGLAGPDGQMRTIRPGLAGQAGDVSQRDKLLRRPLPRAAPGNSELFDGARWFLDGRSRYVGWYPVAGTDLTALVGLDSTEVLAGYLRIRDETLATTWWNTAWLIVATILTASFYVLASWKKHQLETVRATYRLATEDAGDGFFINRPVHGEHGRVVDFLVVDCNQHGAQLFGLQRDKLVGHCLSEFYSGAVFERAMERLCEALDKGIFDREIQVGADRFLKASWIRYKAVRADGDLAVTIRDISESKAHLQELERRSNEDELTGLPNRYWIHQYLPQAIDGARETGKQLALLFVDLDGFKKVNDALGHACGDQLLRTVAKRLTIAVRPHDHVVRLGGDEFVVLLENIERRADVEQVAARVLAVFRDGFHLQQATHMLGASIGISLFPEHGEDAQTLLKNADIAMYSVKTEGKGSYRFFQSRFYEAIRTRLETELELRQAIEQQQFVMHYQPRIDLAAGTTSSMEALVRWQRPGVAGLTGPDEFIPLAEETGLIDKLGELVIDSVCRQLSDWGRDGQHLIPVSINVSPRQFKLSDMPAMFQRSMARYGIDPALIEIEVTESSMMQQGITESAVFHQLRDLGIKLCIDDFGTGYSSMSQLQKMRFDVLKIDRAFVLRIDCPEGDTLIASMIAMAHALGMRVVAEGVENRRQMQFLKSLGCDEGQGFFFSKPIPPTEHQPQLAKAFLPAIAPHA
ncbi:MAG TPA: EAL domain-containing protein [Telluria sp.]